MIGPKLSKIGGMETSFFSWMERTMLPSLISLFKERDSSPENSVHFLFPNDVDSGPPSTNHIVVDVSGFSAGFGAFEKGCAKAQ